MSNKRINKAYIRYDGNGRVIPGALLLNRFKPTGGGKWHEIPAYECCNPVIVYTLRLLFDDIENANSLVGDSSSVSDWNIFFDLPAYGNPFTSVNIVGNEVQLIGGSNIETKFRLFNDYEHLLEVNDSGALVILGDETFGGENGTSALTSIIAPNVTTTICEDTINYGVFGQCYNLINVYLPKCKNLGAVTFYACENLPQSGLTLSFNEITYIGDYTFDNCYLLTEANFPAVTYVGAYAFDNCDIISEFNFPLATYIGEYAFSLCYAMTLCNLPSCIELGPTVGDDNVFAGISSQTITLTVPTALMTADAGNPDGDIAYLQFNNTVTVITV